LSGKRKHAVVGVMGHSDVAFLESVQVIPVVYDSNLSGYVVLADFLVMQTDIPDCENYKHICRAGNLILMTADQNQPIVVALQPAWNRNDRR